MLPFITIFGREIPVYGLCFTAGMILAVWVACLLSKNSHIKDYDVQYSAVIAGIGGLIGAKLLFIIVSWKTIMEYDLSFMDVMKGGFVFYGGLIGGIIGLFIYVKGYKLDAGDFFDLFATVIPFGHAIGRVGCFLGGCCYGMEYDGPLSVTYHINIGNTPTGVPLFPVQLAEAFLLLILFGVMVWIYKREHQKWTPVIVYGFAYCIIRFVLEYLRGDKLRGFALGMSTSQLISLIFAVALFILLIIRSKNKAKQ